MSDAPTHLRLFPLQSTVLFPGMDLPLVVFEPRYLQLTAECREAGEPFGVLLLREGREVGEVEFEPFTVGCTAHITEVEEMGGGRLRMNAVGARRFRVVSFDRSRPYLAAEVEYLEEPAKSTVGEELIRTLKQEASTFVREMLASRGGYVQRVSFPSDPVVLSYQVAQLFSGHAGVQQALLEAGTPHRLEEELNLVRSAREQLARKRRQRPGSSFSKN
jgi:Lon protease-like protein